MKILKWLKKLFTGQLVLIDKYELFLYKQLEEKEKSLLIDIYNLIRKADEVDGVATKQRYEMSYDLTEALWSGTRKGIEHFKGFCGYFNITPDEIDSATSAE